MTKHWCLENTNDIKHETLVPMQFGGVFPCFVVMYSRVRCLVSLFIPTFYKLINSQRFFGCYNLLKNNRKQRGKIIFLWNNFAVMVHEYICYDYPANTVCTYKDIKPETNFWKNISIHKGKHHCLHFACFSSFVFSLCLSEKSMLIRNTILGTRA